MDKLQPVAITAMNNDSYCVRFETSTGEVEFTFTIENVTIENESFSNLAWDPEYSKLVGSDPAALALNTAIFKFHDARTASY